MRKHRGFYMIWVALAAIILIAIPSFIRLGPELIGKKFTDSHEFQWQMDAFYRYVGPNVLNPLDREEAAKKITVSEAEIEEHRARFGTLSDQLASIQDQYDEPIREAKEAGNETVLQALVKERDMKLADIQQNFEDDSHVEAKIRKEKTQTLNQYLDEIMQERPNIPVYYKLVDVDSGQEYAKGDIDVPALYRIKFGPANLYQARSLPAGMEDSEYINYGDSYFDLKTSVLQNPVKEFEGVIVVPKTVISEGGPLVYDYKRFTRSAYMMYAFWAIALLALILLLTGLKFRKDWVLDNRLSDAYDRLKIDGKAAIFLIALLLFGDYLDSISSSLANVLSSFRLEFWTMASIRFVLLGMLPIGIIVFQIISGIERWKQPGNFAKDAAESYTAQLFQAFQNMFLNAKIGTQAFILLIGFFLAGIGFVASFIDPIFTVLYILCVMFLGFPALFLFVRNSAYLSKILVATEAMAAGRLHEDIKVKGKSPLAEHARNLNNLREGVRVSMTEQAKSERLKTELITNVSHDLRTPLTSIITYTDLLKNEALSPEERAQYVDILDKKSQRLKTLIEDLFEVSKMASGNMELTKQRVDLTQLLQQAMAEHAEDVVKSNLDLRTDLPEEPVIAYVDGQRWWRVLDNLIVNAIKYSLPGTRVYVTLRKTGGEAEFVVKNITKYELGANVDELFERFKRADAARHTEGSGLGLAIAQSIVDMHHGTMRIDLDGDLFKVTVTVPVS